MIAHWSFDDGTAKDVTGNGYDGVMFNNPQVVQGIKGNALRFVGSGDVGNSGGHIIIPPINFVSLGEFSITFWINEETWTGNGRGNIIIFGDINTGWLGFMISKKAAATSYNDIYLQFAVGAAFNDLYPPKYTYDPLFYPYSSTDKYQWIFYAMTYQNGSLKAYKNNVFLGQINQSIKIATTNSAIARSWWENGGQTSTRFTGSLDDIRIYNKALSQVDLENIRQK